MRKAIFIGILSALAVIVCGAGALWWIQAGRVKAQVEAIISASNGDTPWLIYDRLETSGFPNFLYIDIVNPRIQGRVDTLLKPLMGRIPVGPEGTPQDDLRRMLENIPQWHEQWALNGRVRLGINWLSNVYRLTSDGTAEGTSTFEDFKVNYRSEIKNYVCEMKLKADFSRLVSTAWELKPEMFAPEILAQSLRHAGCSLDGIHVADLSDQAPIFTGGPFRVKIDTKPTAEDRRELNLDLEVKELEYGARYDVIVKHVQRAFKVEAAMVNAQVPMEAYGKQSLNLAFYFDGPVGLSQIPSGTPAIVRLDALNFKNALVSSQSNFSFEQKAPENAFLQTLRVHSTTRFQPRYTQLVKDNWIMFVRNFILQFKQDPDIGMTLKNHTTQELAKIFEPVLPQLDSLGDIQFDLEADVHGTLDGQSQEVTLKNLLIATTPYGISAQGQGKKSSAQIIPEGTLSVTCRSCATMLQDAGNYLDRVYVALNQLNPKLVADWSQPSLMLRSFNDFLKSVTADSSAETYTYDIKSNGMTVESVNDKPFVSVVQLYMQHMTPAMAPAAE